MQVPIFAPNIRPKATLKSMAPEANKDWIIPIKADDD